MGKLIKGIHHVSLRCADEAEFERTQQFYGGVLGLNVLRSWNGGGRKTVMFTAGNALVEVSLGGKESSATGAVNHFALATDDTDACVDAVRSAGYAVSVGPKDVVLPSEPPLPARIAFCTGPVGESIEFFCEK